MFSKRRYLYVLLGIGIISVSGIHLLNRPRGTGNRIKDIQIRGGEGPILVGQKLVNEKIIRNVWSFRAMLILTGNSGDIKKGIFEVSDSMSLSEIIGVITSGATKTVTVTIPEGYHNRQIGDVLAAKGFFKDRKEFLSYAKDPEIRKKYKIPAGTVEGYLFPDTYYIPIGYPKEKIISMMIDNFLEKTSALEGFPEDSKKRHELIILASIVEREAQKEEERDLIAGVFQNRLNENYPLESCATIQYHFDKPKKRLFYKDLEIQSPYNTYLHAGLPPGPIANPGIKAIIAALRPKETEFKYFVVKNDGSHYFSKTYSEHLRAKNQYLLK